MRNALLLALVFCAAAGFSPASIALAQQPALTVAAPLVDTFEDGGNRLKLVGLPSHDGTGLELTLVYEDADRHVVRSITIDPDLVEGEDAEVFNAFVEQMDPDFYSFVRATLADRLLHIRSEPRAIDIAEAMIFFHQKADDLRQARHGAAWEGERTAE